MPSRSVRTCEPVPVRLGELRSCAKKAAARAHVRLCGERLGELRQVVLEALDLLAQEVDVGAGVVDSLLVVERAIFEQAREVPERAHAGRERKERNGERVDVPVGVIEDVARVVEQVGARDGSG